MKKYKPRDKKIFILSTGYGKMLINMEI